MIQDMIDAVRICRMTGCDGVDINAYGGYLLDEFLTDAFNHRTDEFGGSMDGKLKVLLDVIKAVKKEDSRFSITLPDRNIMQKVLDRERWREKYIRNLDVIFQKQ